MEIRWCIIVVVVVMFCCLRLVEFFVRGNDCTHFKTLFLRTDVRVRSEIVWGRRIRVVMICAVQNTSLNLIFCARYQLSILQCALST